MGFAAKLGEYPSVLVLLVNATPSEMVQVYC